MADEAHMSMIRMSRVVADTPHRNISSTRILKPLSQLRARGSAASGLSVERFLQRVIHEDELHAVPLQPVLEEGPLRASDQIAGRDAPKTARFVTAASLEERDICIPTALVAPMSRQASSVTIAEIVNPDSRSVRMSSAHGVKAGSNPLDGLLRAPGDSTIPNQVRWVRLQTFSLGEGPPIGRADGLREARSPLTEDHKVTTHRQTTRRDTAIPARHILYPDAISSGDPGKRLPFTYAMHQSKASWPHREALTNPQAIRAQTLILRKDLLHIDAIASCNMTQRLSTSHDMLCTFARRAPRRDDKLLPDPNGISGKLIPLPQLIHCAVKALRKHAERVTRLHGPDLPFGGRSKGPQSEARQHHASDHTYACMPILHRKVEPYACSVSAQKNYESQFCMQCLDVRKI